MAESNETRPADGVPPNKGLDYYESKYPYVLPKDDVLELLGEELTLELTPLENAFTRWFIQIGNASLALQSLIHPAHTFDVKEITATKIMSRPTVKNVIKKVKKRCPYMRLYTADYITEILHDEIQYLRYRNRKERFYGADSKLTDFCGKKSLHEEETSDIELLLRCLEVVQKLNAQVSNATDPDTKPGDVSSGIDRLIAEAKRVIDGAKVSVDGRVGQGT